MTSNLSAGVTVVETPDFFWGRGRTGWDPWDTVSRVVSLSGFQWDVVHAWDCRPAVILPALYAFRQSRKTGGKLIIDWCDWWGRGGTQSERADRVAKWFYGPIETFFEEAFRPRADGTTVISRALYQRALGLKIPEENIRIMPQGCDVDGMESRDRVEARIRLGLCPKKHVVVSLGALTSSEAKLLFDCFRLLLERRRDCVAVMVGKHGSRIPADLQTNKEQFIEMGYVSEETLNDSIAACDAVLIPLTDTVASRARWPSKANRFLAAGRTVVISRVGDLAQLLEREGAGLVVPCQAEGIVDGLIGLLDDTGLRTHFETQAQRVAREILAWPSLAGQLEEFYLDCRHNSAVPVDNVRPVESV